MAEFGGPDFYIPIYILTCVYWFILSPLSLFYVYKLWELSSHNIPFFTKRHPKLITVSCILFNIYPTILRPFADLTRAHGVFHYRHALPRSTVNIMQWYLLLEYMRLWLLYYDYNYALHTLALKWKQQILKEETNIPWTHRYRWLGNVKILSIITSVLSVLFVLIIVCGEVFYGQTYSSYMQLVPLLCTLLMMVIAFKVRKCRDEFMIQKEFRIYGISLIGVIVLYIILQMVSTAGTNLRYILFNMFTCFCCYIMAFVSTHWAITQFNAQRNKHQPLLDETNLNKSVDEVQKDVESRLSLEDVLSSRDGFDVFANHLVREFSIENLFFVFEMVQLKKELMKHRLITEQDIGAMIAMDFHRVNRLKRKDSCIYSVDDMKTNIEYIVRNYIEMNGAYSINVSFEMREKFQNNYQQLQKHDSDKNTEMDDNDREVVKKYIAIFDECMDEIIDLMRGDSLVRFYQTEEYKRLVKDMATT
eukprot:56537_1